MIMSFMVHQRWMKSFQLLIFEDIATLVQLTQTSDSEFVTKIAGILLLRITHDIEIRFQLLYAIFLSAFGIT